MVLKECSCYETCITMYRESSERQSVPFTCNGCIGYRNYELGFMQGVKEAIRKINELPESMIRPMTATESQRGSEEYYLNCLRKLKGE